jgi:hypothetical protein
LDLSHPDTFLFSTGPALAVLAVVFFDAQRGQGAECARNAEATVSCGRVRRGKVRSRGYLFNLEGEADRPFNRENMILIVHVVEK